MVERVKRLQTILDSRGVDAFIGFNTVNVRYLSGMKAVMKNDGRAVVSRDGLDIVTWPLNKEQAEQEGIGVNNVVVLSYGEDQLANYIKKRGFKSVAFEEDVVVAKEIDYLRRALPDVEFVYGCAMMHESMRQRPECDIALFREVCDMTDRIFDCVLEILKPGITEKDIEALVLAKIDEFGGEGPSFHPIIVSGARASMPHGAPTDKKLETGDFLTVDMGVKYKGVASDFTRTVVIGRATDRQKEIYETVRRSQTVSVDKIKVGMTGFEADKISRDVIEEAGYGEYYFHSLGHGFGDGIRIINDDSFTPLLKENMVFTIEPGIYIAGYGGVRIEDTVLLTKDGCESLFRTTKELIEIV